MQCTFPALQSAYDQLGRTMTKLSGLQVNVADAQPDPATQQIAADLLTAQSAIVKATNSAVAWLKHLPA